jgi:DNA-binding response OmpR family regulator
MRLLVAEDDRVTARLLSKLTTSWGYEVTTCEDGLEALSALADEPPPALALLDWMLPGMDGPEICRRIRQHQSAGGVRTYVVLLTSRAGMADVVTGLDAGADDYLTKPFHAAELSARLRVGARMASLQQDLITSVRDLTAALAKVRELSGLLPICAYCKSIRGDSDYWYGVESYLSQHSEVEFTHGICPECFKRLELEIERQEG